MEANDSQLVLRALREIKKGTALQISYKAFGKHSNQSPSKKLANRVLQTLLRAGKVIKDTNKQPPVFSLALEHHSIAPQPIDDLKQLRFPNGPLADLPAITPLNTGSPRPPIDLHNGMEELTMQTQKVSNLPLKRELIIFDLDQRASDIDKVEHTAWVIATASHYYNGRIPKNWKIIRATGDKKGEAYNRLLLHLSELLFTNQLTNTNRIIVYSKNSMYQSFSDILAEYGIQFLQG